MNEKLKELTKIIQDEKNLIKRLRDFKQIDSQDIGSLYEIYYLELDNLRQEIENFIITQNYSLQTNHFSEKLEKVYKTVEAFLIKEENINFKREWAIKNILHFLDNIQVISAEKYKDIISYVIQEAFENFNWKTYIYENMEPPSNFLWDICKIIIKFTEDEFKNKLNDFRISFEDIGLTITQDHFKDLGFLKDKDVIDYFEKQFIENEKLNLFSFSINCFSK